MVRRAIRPALSDVLGRASGLSTFAVYRAARAGGRTYRSQPARSSLHQYRDELHVSQRGLVVLFDADPILSYFSLALLGSSKIWRSRVSDHCVRPRIRR